MMTTSTTHADASARFAGIARSAESVSLELLRVIDGTVDALGGLSKVADGLATLVTAIATELNEAVIIEGDYLDENDTTIDSMERTANDLKEYLTRLVCKRAAIDKDHRLCNHHCEALHEAYETAIDSVAELIEALQTARAAIISHDLKAESRGGAEVFASADELIANLRSE